MDRSWSGRLRIDQSCRRIDHLREAVTGWLVRRRADDRLRQYETQLNALDAVLTGGLTDLRAAIGMIPDSEPAPTVYGLCRINDRRAELIRRVFEFYRQRFDQRDDPAAAPTLKAADEVAWSCWAEPFRNARRERPGLVRSPCPLPYFEPDYSPAAVPRDEPPGDLAAGDDDTVLRHYLARLPVPVVALPTVCVDDPAWLVCIGHEIGHHLQHDLAESWQLVGAFGTAVESAAAAARVPGAARWRSWSQEVFADVCSVLSMGPAAVRLVVQLELDDHDRMRRSDKVTYPPPLVRIALMAEVARLRGWDVSTAVSPVAPALATEPATVGALAAAILGDRLGGLGPVTLLYDHDPQLYVPHGSTWILRDGLLARAPLTPHSQLRTPRLLASALSEAWIEWASGDTGKDSESRRAALNDRFLRAVVEAREDQVRSTGTAATDVAALRRQMTGLLMSAIQPGDAP